MQASTNRRPHSLLRIPVMLLTVVAGLCLSLTATAAAQEPQVPLTTELIRVTNASLGSAYQLAIGVCNSVRADNACSDVQALEAENLLSVSATPPVIARIRSLLAEFDRPPETRSFQIIVLAADRSGSTSPEVPANVQEALQDVRDFLPYDGFRLIGSGWLRTSEYASTTLPGSEEFIAELRFRPTTDPDASVLVEEFTIYRIVPVSRLVDGATTTDYTQRNVVQSTFTITRGQTVVVGTSKLNGDDTAAVVLLTAIQD